MAHSRSLLAIAFLGMIVHAVVIARTLVPAQDGLKFIRVARQFQTEPWSDVIRGTDVHPLYPALVAVLEPALAWLGGSGPDTWRITAQIVAAIFSIGLLVPVYLLTASLFDRRIAFLAAGIAALLPRAAEIGHDTLADSLGLFTTFAGLWLGARALRTGDWRFGRGSGLLAGFGYLARPEVILVPAAIGLTWLCGFVWDARSTLIGRRHHRARLGEGEPPGEPSSDPARTEPRPPRFTRSHFARLPAVSVLISAAMLVVGCYAAVKGEISEKLAVRHGASLGPQQIMKRKVAQHLPRGLDDPRWDFSPKEETDRIPISNWRAAVMRIAGKWWEELCWFFAVMAVWGLVRRRYIRSLLPHHDPENSRSAERVIVLFACVYGLVLTRHSALLGYLSGRHVLVLVVAAIPWTAAGTYVCALGIARKLSWSGRTARWVRSAAMGLTVAASIVVQMIPSHLNHLTRWGHWAAGQWLAAHARPDELILDTRGWARFISGRPGYDYWHVRQALTDSHLSYVLVGLDELETISPRAATLRALLAYAATPLIDFPAYPGATRAAVRLYRFHRPSSWEGLAR
jgi:hypothetical protein